MSKHNDVVERVSYHYETPQITTGGFLEIVGSREMLRLGDELEYIPAERQFKLTERWKPGNFDREIYG